MSEKTAPESDRSPSPQSLADSLKVGIPLVTLAGMLLVGYFVGPAPAILVLAGGALIGVIATFWASLRTLFGETPLSGADAYAIGAPRAEEEQKQAVLRALKDLEFERSVGKISEEDYQALVARYRAEAKRLLRLIDESARPRREQVEALVSSHLRKEGLLDEGAEAAKEGGDEANEPETSDEANEAKARAEARDEEESSAEAPAEEKRAAAPKEQRKKKRGGKGGAAAKKPKDEPAALAEEPEKPEVKDLACSECGTINDADAVFCKKCGARQKPAAEPSADRRATDSEAGAS